jgi:outer membrane immunogenic protein
MKFRALIASVAFTVLGTAIAGAADMAVKAPPPPPPPVFSWTGFYVGANIGGAWTRSGWTDTRFLTTSDTVSNSVFIGGGQIGGNYQIGQFVIGGEWDFDGASNINGGASIPGDIVVANSNLAGSQRLLPASAGPSITFWSTARPAAVGSATTT